MNFLKQRIKLFACYCIRFILKIFYIIPVNKNKYFFCDSYTGNPKFLYEYMKKNHNEQNKYVWGIIETERYKNCGIEFVKFPTELFPSFKFCKEFYSSKFIVASSQVPAWINIKANQVLVNTWHGGGAYKKVGNTKNEIKNSYYNENVINIEQKETSYFVSSSKRFSDVIGIDLKISPEKFLNFGMARNDIFFNQNEKETAIEKVRNFYNIDNNTGIILFAPTYRGKVRNAEDVTHQLDISKVVECASKKFARKFIFLYRAHHFTNSTVSANNNIIDASKYIEMQELLCTADVFITDYSSSIWDYSFTNKPGFLFVPDLDNYNNERGLHTPVDTWPFEYAKTNEELCLKIENWDSHMQIKKNKTHHEYLGSYENGDATKKLYDALEKIK